MFRNHTYHKNFILGAPIRKSDRRAFEEGILKRFNYDYEKAVAFVGEIADRQMSKSSGILSCTSILAGISYFVHAPIALIITVITLVPAAVSFYPQWPSTNHTLHDPKYDFVRTSHISYVRAIFNSLSVFLLIFTVFLLVPHILRIVG